MRSGKPSPEASRAVRAAPVPRSSALAALADAPDVQIDRWIRRMVLLLVVGALAFGAFYAVDRWRPASPSIASREVSVLEQAVRDDPADIAARGRLADVYVASGRLEEAIVQYDAVIASGKADKLGYIGRARARAAAGQLDGAAEDYKAVVAMATGGEMANVDPLLEAGYYGLGDIALKQGRPDEAIEHLTAALNIKRSDADALNLIGAAYLAAGRTDEAVGPLRRAVAFVPIGWAEPYETLAIAYAEMGRQIDSEWAGAMAALASGDDRSAESRLLAIADGPAAVDATVGLGLVNESQGDLGDASFWYQRALGLDPKNAPARLGLGRVGAAEPAGPSQLPSSGPALPTLPAPGGAEGGTP